MSDERLLTLPEISAETGIPLVTLRRLRRDGWIGRAGYAPKSQGHRKDPEVFHLAEIYSGIEARKEAANQARSVAARRRHAERREAGIPRSQP